MISPYHLEVADQFLADLAAAVDAAPAGPAPDGPVATYGGIA